MTREIVLARLCSRALRSSLNMDMSTDRRGKREILTTSRFFPRRGFKVADNDAPTAQRNERREERVRWTQVERAAGRVPAARHTVEISDSVLATMRRRAPTVRDTVAAFDVTGESEAN